jgi:hypothetical protein
VAGVAAPGQGLLLAPASPAGFWRPHRRAGTARGRRAAGQVLRWVVGASSPVLSFALFKATAHRPAKSSSWLAGAPAGARRRRRRPRRRPAAPTFAAFGSQSQPTRNHAIGNRPIGSRQPQTRKRHRLFSSPQPHAAPPSHTPPSHPDDGNALGGSVVVVGSCRKQTSRPLWFR